MVLKKIAAGLFVLAFAMALLLFTNIGSGLLPLSTVQFLFLASGAVAFILNLVSFRHGKHSAEFNLFFWLGSIFVFIGLVFKIMHWPYSTYLLLAGLAVVGVSYLYNPFAERESNDENELLDSK
jgi:hypothetical protein